MSAVLRSLLLLATNLLTEGSFIGNGNAPAFDAAQAKIGGSVFFKGAVGGEVRFTSASIAGNFEFRIIGSPKNLILDLKYAKVGTLFNPADSWPKGGNLYLDGFTYDRIGNVASQNARVQLGWLRLQRRDHFSLQPYEQLASVLRKMGRPGEAVKVMVAKSSMAARYAIDKWL